MSDTFIAPDSALLWLNLETSTVNQDTLIEALLPWTDNVILSEIGFDPRTDPEYANHSFGDLVLIAGRLFVAEFRSITNESSGVESATFNALSVKFREAPTITPEMERTFRRYRKLGMGV